MTSLRSPVRRAAALVPALGLAIALASCGGDGGSEPSPDGRTSGEAAIVVADAPSLPRAPDALPPIDVQGYETILAEVRGTPLVVNFWASWCEPCEREMPLLAAAAEEHRDAIQFLGIDILDTVEPAREFVRRYDVPYPNAFDAMGSTRDAVGSLGQPVTIFYGADGGVVAKIDGELSARQLDATLAELLVGSEP